MTLIDSAWNNPDGEAFLTRGSKYRSFSSEQEKSLLDKWKGLGFSSIDAALIGAGKKQGKVYFFSGDQYTRFDSASGKFDPGYPRSIKKMWKTPFSKVDAAWNHPWGKDKYYLANGSEYVRITEGKGVDQGFPQKLSKHWVNFDHLDAVVRGKDRKSGKLYFFSGHQYVRYDIESGKVDKHFPQPILRHWSLPSSWKPSTKHVRVRLIDVTCRTTEDSGPAGSADELTVIWGGFFGNKTAKGQWRLKSINDGDRKFFPANKTVIFEGDLTDDAPVEIIISLWDRDHGEGADQYRKAFNDSISTVEATGEAAGVAAVAKAMDLSGIVAEIVKLVDSDDFLGEEKMEETVVTLRKGKEDNRKEHILRFRKKGADYKVRIRTEVS